MFYFRASMYDVGRALFQMHRMGGGSGNDQRPVRDGRKITIAPIWLKEYAGLVSSTANVKCVERGDNAVVRLKWSAFSRSTPETMERVTNDAAEGLERAHDIFLQLIGPPVAKPRKSKG